MLFRSINCTLGAIPDPTFASGTAIGAPAEVKTQHDAVVHGKHAKKKRISGRAKVKAPGKGAVASRRRFQKRTQSGT